MFDREVASVVSAVTVGGAYTATKYISPRLIVRATRRFGRKQKADLGTVNRAPSLDVVLTISHPNYLERKFIKQAKKAGEQFPIKKIQLKYSKVTNARS